MEQNRFEKSIKPVLLWVGTIVASIMAVAYIIVAFVLIEGFKAKELLTTTVFAAVTAAVGFCIMQMLKIQGQSFAQELPENKKILEEYYKNKTKDKKNHSIKYFWVTSVIKDVISKCSTLALTSVGMIYIVIEGSGDYNLLLLAATNLLMFAGFGLVSLVKTYDFYNQSYVPYMLEKIEEAKQEEINKQKAQTIGLPNDKVENCQMCTELFDVFKSQQKPSTVNDEEEVEEAYNYLVGDIEPQESDSQKETIEDNDYNQK